MMACQIDVQIYDLRGMMCGEFEVLYDATK